MKARIFVYSLLLCVLAVVSGSPVDASVARFDGSPNESRAIVLKLSDLRSANLLRADAVHYDSAQMSPAGVRGQLQRHFNVVLGVLIATTPRSVEVALDRLEAASGRTLAATERALMRRQLLRNRLVQLRRLAAYRDRGVFPLNEGQAAGAVPIFVDAHDTACAVGHLMRLSGWQDSVAAIQQANNLVYVPDAAGSAVARWALSSGLTLEEAALVQPAYGGFLAPFFLSDYEPGEAVLINNGLKYENFRMEARNYQLAPGASFHAAVDTCGPASCSQLVPLDSGFLPDESIVGFNAGEGPLFGVISDVFDPVGTHWINLGGSTYSPGFPSFPLGDRLLQGRSVLGHVQRLFLSFDVSTVNPSQRVKMIAQHSYPTYAGFDWPFGSPDVGQFEMTTEAIHMGSSVGSAHFEELPSVGIFESRIATGDLLPRDHLTVATTIWLYNGEAVDSYVIGLEVVPEPQSLLLGIGAMFGMLLVRCRNRPLEMRPTG